MKLTCSSAGTAPTFTSTTSTPENFQFHIGFTQLPNGWYFLGELNKITTVSVQRFSSIDRLV